MREMQKGQKKKPWLCTMLIQICMLMIICVPLLWIARYNYPSADDFVFSTKCHNLFLHRQYVDILPAAMEQVYETYFKWQGSFSAVFLMALQPGIFGEQYYGLCTLLFIGSILLGMWLFLWRGLGCRKENRRAMVTMWAFICSVQILLVPYPNETFYWYNGSLYYTFFYALELILFSEVFLLLHNNASKRKMYLHLIAGGIIAFFLGGGNLATGMGACLSMCLLCATVFIRKNSNRKKLYFLTILLLLGYLINLIAPGNSMRAASTEVLHSGVIETIWLSLLHSAQNIYSWTDIKMLLYLLCLLPLWVSILRKDSFHFPLPGLFTLFAFGVYASQLAPISYVNGSLGPCRMGNIIWYTYVLLLTVIEGYWTGWLLRKRKGFGELRGLGAFYLLVLALWCLCFLSGDYKATSTYQAVRCIKNGEAKAYGEEMEERFRILRDDSVKDAELAEIQHKTELLFYCDIAYEGNDITVAEYYGKNSVRMKE